MKQQWIWASLVVVAIGVSWALLHGDNSHAQTAAPSAAPEVTVAQALTRKVGNSSDFTGELQAVNSAQVQPRVGGFIEAVRFHEGALVHKGDVLFQLDARSYQAEVDRLKADQAQARAQLNLAQTNQHRAQMLLAQHAVAKQEVDTQNAAEQSARATLEASSAALAAAQLNLDFTQVRSPIDGRVSNARVTAGNLVTSSDVLTSVVSVNPVYVYFDVDEQTWLKLDRLRAGASKDGDNAHIAASMGLVDETGYPHKGRIDFVDNRVQSSSGTMRLRAVFNNADGTYTPGLYARVRLQSGQPSLHLLIDDRAIGSDQGNQFVYVVDAQHKVQYRKVDTGPLLDGLRVINSGLKANELVIVNGLQRVRPGAEVKPQKVAMDVNLDAHDKALVEAGNAVPKHGNTDVAIAAASNGKHSQD